SKRPSKSSPRRSSTALRIRVEFAGENGRPSHGGTWDDAPSIIKECALNNGFSGKSMTNENFNSRESTPEVSVGAKAVLYIGGAAIIFFGFLSGAGS
ncbi:hypothetical protein, partial [Xanthomonas oryzae]